MEKAKKYPFPIEQTLSDKFCRENFWKCLYESASDNLHYWIILPNNVKPIEVRPTKANNTTVIGQYIRLDDGPYLEVLVLYEYYEHEMNVSDWAEKKLYKMGEQLVDHRIIEGKSTGNYLDVLTSRKLNEEETVISRITTTKDSVGNGNGANYFMAIARCLENDYEELANTILQIVSNWDLTNRSQWQFGELLQKFSYPVEKKVEFYVPKSWDMRFEEESIHTDSPHFYISHIEGDNNGVINAYFYQSNVIKKYEDIVEMYFGRLEILDDDKIELKPFEVCKPNVFKNPVIHTLYQTTGTIINDEINFHAHIQIAVIKTSNGWYYFELVGSRHNLENDNWEINKRCLELIIKSFNNLNFDEDKDEYEVEVDDDEEEEEIYHL